MERPKVRFSQVNESNLFQNELNTNKQGSVMIKSIEPVNFPIKILKNGKRALAKNQNYSNDNRIMKRFEETHTLNTNQNEDKGTTEYFDSQTSISEVCNSSIEFESKIVNKELESENLKMNKINDSSETETITNKVQSIIINDSRNLPYETNKVKQSKNLTNFGKNSSHNSLSDTNMQYITCNNCEEDSNLTDIQIISSSNIQSTKKNDKPTETVMNCNASLKHQNRQKNYFQHNKYPIVPKNANKENYPRNTNCDKSELSNCSLSKDLSNQNDNKISENVCKEKQNVKDKKKMLPCAESKLIYGTKGKCVNKSTKTQVKKSSVFHVSGNHCSVSVIPEVMTKKNRNDDIKEINEKKNINSKDLLSHPEYNSMISVIKKIKDIKKERVVTDKKLLPQEYKNCISEKISAALDFSPYETVYKDLIDLSVDDDKFPIRLMRSKDPEPRNKDIVPKLSDFYNPKFSDQYFTAINPPFFNPVNMNALSTFTISNKISMWKACRNYF